MKKYVSCFLFFLFLTGGCLLTLFFVTKSLETDEVELQESAEQPVFADNEEDETFQNSSVSEKQPDEEASLEYHVVLNQEDVEPALEGRPWMDGLPPDSEGAKYCLMSEEGYLIVYDKDTAKVSMFTHMPLTDFPLAEQERLVEGIWFATMVEIFSYLESYTS